MPLRILAFVVVLCAPRFLLAAEPAPSGQVIRLAITPAVEPVPALRYQLLPTFVEQRPGNAAVRYLRVAAQYRPADEVNSKIADMLAKPLAEFAKAAEDADVKALLERDVFVELQRAARLDRCEWELPFREQFAFAILLPELQEMRRLARYVALRARRDVVDGNFDAAVERLKIGYAMARHTAAAPTLVNGLVGASIAQMMNQVLLDMAQSPDAPSLYWAVAFQPRPFIDPRPGLLGEMASPELSFPAFFPPAENRTTEEWTKHVQRLLQELSSVADMFSANADSKQSVGNTLAFVGIMAKVVFRREELRAALVRYGLSEAEVKRMSDPQLFVEYGSRQFRELRDDQFRWWLLPYHESRAGLEAAEQRLREEQQAGREVIPLASLLLPAVNSVRHSYAKSERRLDALRIVEALRFYAGKHDGQLPKSLADVTEAPIPPLDLVTGKPFRYTLGGETARLELPEEGNFDKLNTTTYEITIAGKR